MFATVGVDADVIVAELMLFVSPVTVVNGEVDAFIGASFSSLPSTAETKKNYKTLAIHKKFVDGGQGGSGFCAHFRFR